jgi:hypothetical protein
MKGVGMMSHIQQLFDLLRAPSLRAWNDKLGRALLEKNELLLKEFLSFSSMKYTPTCIQAAGDRNSKGVDQERKKPLNCRPF